jgi:hypothetical protein
MSKINDSPEDRKRVSLRVAALVLDFCKGKRMFRMQELTEFVSDGVDGYVAPDSPGRILRLLKQQGKLNYRLMSRSDSLYSVL